MSRIDELIAEHCPNGVEFKALDDIITHLRTGLNPRQNFKLNSEGSENFYITVRELGGFSINPSSKTDRIDEAALTRIQARSQLQAGDILFSGTGTIGRTALVSELPRNWNIKEGIFALSPITSSIDARFLIYLFNSAPIKQQILSSSDGSTVASVSMASLRRTRIPVPPLEVQQEIVRILDQFKDPRLGLEAELEAEDPPPNRGNHPNPQPNQLN